jgi:hypothetical protein
MALLSALKTGITLYYIDPPIITKYNYFPEIFHLICEVFIILTKNSEM